MKNQQNEILGKLIKKEQIAKDTWQFVFEKPKTFSFQAGQYITLFLGKDNRDFTICTYPKNDNYFSVVTKKGISEFKKTLFSLPLGSIVTVKQPSGGFILHENKTLKVFLAGGIGVTVFYTIIQDVVRRKLKIPITLFVSFSKKEDIIFYDELQKIEKENQSIKIVYTLTQDTWNGETGRISEKLIKKYVSDIQNVEYMIAGGEKMVEDTEERLLHMGINQDKIRIDIFTGY